MRIAGILALIAGLALAQAATAESYPLGERQTPATLRDCPAGFNLVANSNSGTYTPYGSRIPWVAWCYRAAVQWGPSASPAPTGEEKGGPVRAGRRRGGQ